MQPRTTPKDTPEDSLNARRRLAIPIIIIIIIMAALSTVCVRFLLDGMYRAIEDNGKSGMRAVVEQLQQSYDLQVENYYSRLRILESYASQGAGDLLANEGLVKLVNTLQKETGWQILFIKDNGDAATIERAERKLDVSSSLLGDLQDGRNIAKLISYNDGSQTQYKFLLAIPCEPYTMGGKTYSSIGALVDRSEMDAVLKMYAYDGAAFLFMLNDDGEVLYTNQTDEKIFQNYSLLKHLKQDNALTADQMSDLQAKFDSRSLGVELYSGEKPYYLGYAPIDNNNATIVCIVAQGVVDNSLSSYQKTVLYSTLGMATLMLVLFGGLFFNMWRAGIANQKAAFERENRRQQQRNLKRLEIMNGELKSAQTVTAQALSSAESANKAKTSFLANMSHDIRTPLNAIIGLTSLIEHDAGDEQRVREYVHRIQVSSQNLLAIINEVLDMNRIESGRATLNCADFSIVDVVKDVEEMFRPQTDERAQVFDVRLAGLSHEWVCGDRVRLVQILSNLLSNAVKYTQRCGQIVLDVEELPAGSAAYARYCLKVMDNGIGIDADFQDKIFDAFTREESTLTNKIQGTGLGMAITKSLVDAMGGTISVQSEKGHGSCFEVVLDFKIAEGAEKGSRPGTGAGADAAEISIAGMRFLCAEDNALNAEILGELLGIEGAECVICENGQALLDTLRRSRPGDFDMILMDVQMPVMNGYETARAIRGGAVAWAMNMPIIAMTANAFSEDIQASLSAGMDAHVSKPINMATLKKAVASVLAARA